MAPPAFQEYANWPEDTPKPFGGGGDFRGHEDLNMEEDIGGLGDDDDPANVPSATSTPHGSDDDDMQS